MTRFETRLLWVSVLVCLGFSGCGNKKDLGADLDIAVAGEGVIIPATAQSCTDKATYTTVRTVGANALIFSNFSLRYTGKGKALLPTSLRITVKGSGIQGGEAEFTVASLELEALLGRRGPLISVPDDENEVIINSNVQSDRTALFPACALAIGPIKVINPDSTFQASVEFRMTAIATNTLTGEVERVEEEMSGKAFF